MYSNEVKGAPQNPDLLLRSYMVGRVLLRPSPPTIQHIYTYQIKKSVQSTGYDAHFNRQGDNQNKVFASGQAIRAASYAVLRPIVHGSETSRTQKRSLCRLAASSGVLNPQKNKV